MLLNKLKSKSLISNEDLTFNKRLGLPVEVFCPKTNRTLAFGKITTISNATITIHNINYCRAKHVFFGHPDSPPKINLSSF